MEKGLITKASQDALIAILLEALKDQKGAVKLSASLGAKVLFLVADYIFAEKLPEDLKTKCRIFGDTVLIEKDYEQAIVLGIELVAEIFDLLKKQEPEK